MRGRSSFVSFKLALLALLAFGTQCGAQPGEETVRRGAILGGRGGLGGPFGAGPLELARRSDVQSELGLTDSQIQGIESLAGAQLQQIRDQFRRIADLPREERRKAIAGWQETRVKLTNEARQKINDLLSKSQRSRFAELEFRFHLQRGRIREALASAGVELDEESRDKLDNAEQLVRADVQQRIAQIQQETNTAILAAIMDTATIERLMGDQYIFRADEPLQRGGPGRFLGGSARIERETDDDSPDLDEADDEQSNRRRRRDRSTREEN